MKLRHAWKVVLLAVAAAGALLRADSPPAASQTPPIKLTVKEVPLTVLDRKVKVVAVEQDNGEQGYSPQMTQGFHVEVVNKLPVPTTLHWHGLILPNAMDGVPFVNQDPIPPGGSHAYDFPLQQSGTFWMHSHYGLQEQQLNAAPMIILSPEQAGRAEAQFTVMLSDFSFTDPMIILKHLMGKSGMKGMGEKKGMGGMKSMGDTDAKESLVVQKWDDAAGKFVAQEIKAGAPDIDVKYDALLANRRTPADPEVEQVKPGETVLLRLVAASSATNFFIDTGSLEATILATDGADVQPLKGNFFQLGIAQRLDLLVKIPESGGAFPILALGEGTKLQAGIVLATPGAMAPKMGISGERKAGGLDNTQEVHLTAREPLAQKPVDRSLPSVLGGSMAPYSWTINGAAYPNRNSLDVKEGERVEIVIKNATGMAHPMHLHGHVFEVTEIDGQKITGARRDTILVPPWSTIKVQFDANNPGIWAYHCHIVYHLATGMFTVLKYDGADTKFWQPEKTETELKHPLELGQAIWRDMTDGLFASDAPAATGAVPGKSTGR